MQFQKHAAKRKRKHARESVDLPIHRDHETRRRDEIRQNDNVRGPAPFVFACQDTRKHAVDREPLHETHDANVRRQHGASQHDERIDGYHDLEPMASSDSAHIRQQHFFIRHDAVHRDDSQGQERERDVVNTGAKPHVPQCLWEDAWGLLFNKLRRTFKASDPEHRRPVPKEYSTW